MPFFADVSVQVLPRDLLDPSVVLVEIVAQPGQTKRIPQGTAKLDFPNGHFAFRCGVEGVFFPSLIFCGLPMTRPTRYSKHRRGRVLPRGS
jgi:hypothetical protein